MKTVYGLFSCLCTQFTPQLPLNLSYQTFVGLDLQLCLTTCDMWQRDSRRVLTTWSVLQYLISDNQKKITVGEREIPCWRAWMVVNCETSPTIFSHGSPTPDARGDLGGKLVIHFFVELLRLEKSLHFWKKTDSGCLSLPPPPSPPKIKNKLSKKKRNKTQNKKKLCNWYCKLLFSRPQHNQKKLPKSVPDFHSFMLPLLSLRVAASMVATSVPECSDLEVSQKVLPGTPSWSPVNLILSPNSKVTAVILHTCNHKVCMARRCQDLKKKREITPWLGRPWLNSTQGRVDANALQVLLKPCNAILRGKAFNRWCSEIEVIKIAFKF